MRVLVCVKRPIDGRQDRPHPRRAGDRDASPVCWRISPHEECGVEEAVWMVESAGGESVVLTLGLPEAAEQLRDAMALGADRAIHLVSDGEEWTRRRPRARSSTRSERTRPRTARSTSCSSATSRRTPGTTRSGSVSRTLCRGRWRRDSRVFRSRDGSMRAGGGRRSTCTSCRFQLSSACSKGSTCRATPRCRRSCAHSASRSSRAVHPGPTLSSRRCGSWCPRVRARRRWARQPRGHPAAVSIRSIRRRASSPPPRRPADRGRPPQALAARRPHSIPHASRPAGAPAGGHPQEHVSTSPRRRARSVRLVCARGSRTRHRRGRPRRRTRRAAVAAGQRKRNEVLAHVAAMTGAPSRRTVSPQSPTIRCP